MLHVNTWKLILKEIRQNFGGLHSLLELSRVSSPDSEQEEEDNGIQDLPPLGGNLT
jgi:hypothetical protein